MLTCLSNNIISLFIKEKVINKEDEEVYEYGLELLLSAVISGMVIIIISLIFSRVIESILFMLSFILLRQAAGGYHANTHFKCLLTLLTVYTFFLILLYKLPSSLNLTFLLLFLIISIISIIIFAPADNENKEFTDLEKDKYRKKSIILITFLSMVALIIGLVGKNNNYGLCLSYGILTASISVMIAKLQQFRKFKIMRLYNW